MFSRAFHFAVNFLCYQNAMQFLQSYTYIVRRFSDYHNGFKIKFETEIAGASATIITK